MIKATFTLEQALDIGCASDIDMSEYLYQYLHSMYYANCLKCTYSDHFYSHEGWHYQKRNHSYACDNIHYHADGKYQYTGNFTLFNIQELLVQAAHD